MNKIHIFLTVVFSIMLLASCKNTLEQDTSKKMAQEYVKNQMIVGFNSEVTSEKAKEVIKQANCTIIRYMDSADAYLVEIPDSLEVEEAIKLVSKNASVKYAEPNGIMKAYKK